MSGECVGLIVFVATMTEGKGLPLFRRNRNNWNFLIKMLHFHYGLISLLIVVLITTSAVVDAKPGKNNYYNFLHVH